MNYRVGEKYTWGEDRVIILWIAENGQQGLVKVIKSPRTRTVGNRHNIPLNQLKAAIPEKTKAMLPRPPMPIDGCPSCGTPGYIKGIRCPNCELLEVHTSMTFGEFLNDVELREMARKKKGKTIETQAPKEDGPMVINVGMGRSGHIPHTTGTGVHDNRPRRERSRQGQRKQWEKEQP